MYTEAELRDIFYSGQYANFGDRDLLTKIAFLLKYKYLTCEKIPFCSKTHYLDIASSKKTREDLDLAGGSPQHVALKIIGKEYLHKLGFESNAEFPFCGYWPDLITTDLQTIIECGHTDNIDKIFVYFTQGNLAELIQLPYPDESDTIVYGYRFIPRQGLKSFLLEDSMRDKDQILKIINGRNSSLP